jgi:hypothetical protein
LESKFVIGIISGAAKKSDFNQERTVEIRNQLKISKN